MKKIILKSKFFSKTFVIKRKEIKEEYWHVSHSSDETFSRLDPIGFYEEVKVKDGLEVCPQPLFGDIGAGFPMSKIPEISFSRSIEGAILGGVKNQCEMNKDCVIDIYKSSETPDIDISDCGHDFWILEEVRYRRTIPVEKVMSVVIEEGLIEEINSCYGESEGGVAYIADETLLYLKDHVKEQLKRGSTRLKPMGEEALTRKFEEEYGVIESPIPEGQKRITKFLSIKRKNCPPEDKSELSELELLALKELANRFIQFQRVGNKYEKREDLRSRKGVIELIVGVAEEGEKTLDNPEKVFERFLEQGLIEGREREQNERIIVSMEEGHGKASPKEGFFISKRGEEVLEKQGYKMIFMEHTNIWSEPEYGRMATKASRSYELQAFTKDEFKEYIADLKEQRVAFEADWEKGTLEVYSD